MDHSHKTRRQKTELRSRKVAVDMTAREKQEEYLRDQRRRVHPVFPEPESSTEQLRQRMLC